MPKQLTWIPFGIPKNAYNDGYLTHFIAGYCEDEQLLAYVSGFTPKESPKQEGDRYDLGFAVSMKTLEISEETTRWLRLN